MPHIFPLFADIIPYMMMHSVSNDCDQTKTLMHVETDFKKEKQMKAEKKAATLMTLTACSSSAQQVSTGNRQIEQPLPHFEVLKNGMSYTHTNIPSHTLNMQHLTTWSDFLFRCTENVELNTFRLKSVPSFLCWVCKYRFSRTVIVSVTTSQTLLRTDITGASVWVNSLSTKHWEWNQQSQPVQRVRAGLLEQ